MMKLVKFELKKYFLRLPVVVVILLFLIINAIKINDVYENQGIFSEKKLADFKDEYWKYYQDFGGKITNEKIENLMAIYNSVHNKIKDQTLSRAYDENSYTYNAYSDDIFFNWCFVKEMQYDYYYKAYAEKVVHNALDNMKFYQFVGNEYESRKNYQTAVRFANREITEFHYTEKYLYYLQYDFSVVLVLLICIYALANVFILEKETDMNQILITTVWGGKKTTAAKIIAASLFVFGVSALFWLEDFLIFSVFFGSFGSNSSPLYGLEMFKNTLLNMNLLQYGIQSDIIKILGIWVFCLFILLVSDIFKKTLFSYLVSFVTSGILIMSSNSIFIHGNRIHKILNPAFLLKNRELFREAEFVNFFNYPVPVFYLTIISGLLYALLLLMGIKVITRKNVFRKNKK